jgi:hypothetical protein
MMVIDHKLAEINILTTSSFHQGIKLFSQDKYMQELLQMLMKVKPVPQPIETTPEEKNQQANAVPAVVPVEPMSVCFSQFRDWKLSERLYRDYNIEVDYNMKKHTKMLVVKNMDKHTSKMAEAQRKNITIITLDEFVKRYPTKE